MNEIVRKSGADPGGKPLSRKASPSVAELAEFVAGAGLARQMRRTIREDRATPH